MSAEQSLETIKKEIINLTNSNSLPSQSLTDLKQLDQIVEKILNDYHNQAAASNQEYAEVLYDFQPQQDGDLTLRKGDRIAVLEKMSSDWFKGKDSSNNVGVFPANYVKLLENTSRDSSRPLPPPPTYSAASAASPNQTGGSNNSYYQQMPVQQQQYQQPQQAAPFPPQSTNYYQQQPQQEQQQQPQKTHSQFGKIGSKLGNAFVFGAGATLGGDLVNAIL